MNIKDVTKSAGFSCLSILLALGLFAPHQTLAQTLPSATPPAARHLFVTDATTPQVIPSMLQNRALIRATIEGRQLWFHLDSGTSTLIMDPKVAQSLGLVANDGEVVTDLDVGPLHAHNARFTLMNYDEKAPGLRIAGIIGQPFFRSNVITIDFPNQRVVAYPNGSFSPTSLHAVSAPLSIIHGVPYVHAWFGKQRAAMLLDTGAEETHIFQRFSGMVRLTSSDDAQGESIGLNAPTTTIIPYRTPSLAIGGLYLRNVHVDVAQEAGNFAGNVYADGILGRDILALFAVTFDYGNSTVYFAR